MIEHDSVEENIPQPKMATETIAAPIDALICTNDTSLMAEPEAEGLTEECAVDHSSQLSSPDSKHLHECMQSMKTQVHFLQEVLQKISPREKKLLFDVSISSAEDEQASKLAFPCLSPVPAAKDESNQLDMLKELVLDDRLDLQLDHDKIASQASKIVDRDISTGTSNIVQEQSISSCSSDPKHSSVVADLQTEVAELKLKLATSEEENSHLRAMIQEFEVENARLQDAVTESGVSSTSTNNHVAEEAEEEDAIIDHDVILSTATLKNHERCQEKIHELWQTIRTLKIYVETFRVERDTMKMQRDEAIASADRAWAENSKLAGNSNPQQKIKYLQSIKLENVALHEKIRELQSQIAYAEGKVFRYKVHALEPQHDSDSELSSLSESLLLEGNDQQEQEEWDTPHIKVVRRMWSRHRHLEAEIERLQNDKEQLMARTWSRSSSEDSGVFQETMSPSSSNNVRCSPVSITRRRA